MELQFILFPFLFIGMWVFITFLISKGGWSKLAGKFQIEKPPIAKSLGLISGYINKTRYKNALILKYNDEGIFLSVLFLFRLFHPPLFIPWEEIKGTEESKVLLFKFRTLKIGDPVIARIKLNENTFQKLKDALEKHLSER